MGKSLVKIGQLKQELGNENVLFSVFQQGEKKVCSSFSGGHFVAKYVFEGFGDKTMEAGFVLECIIGRYSRRKLSQFSISEKTSVKQVILSMWNNQGPVEDTKIIEYFIYMFKCEPSLVANGNVSSQFSDNLISPTKEAIMFFWNINEKQLKSML